LIIRVKGLKQFQFRFWGGDKSEEEIKLVCSFIKNQKQLMNITLRIDYLLDLEKLKRFSFLKTQNTLVELTCGFDRLDLKKFEEILPPSLLKLGMDETSNCQGTLFYY
jgi:hypothetical protein